MARITKLPNPENARPNTSLWLIELTAAEIREIQQGGAAVLAVMLPISQPEATYTIKKAV